MLQYPVVLKSDTNGTVQVQFPDVPEAHTFGEDREEALLQAVDALETALSFYVENRRNIPAPSPVKPRMAAVVLPALSQTKLALYTAMRSAGLGKAEMARRLNCHLPQIDRLLDLTHASRLDQIEAAFRVLGKRLDIEIRDAA